MPDVFDEAQTREAAEREAAIGRVCVNAALQRRGGRDDCQDCGNDIPALRRAVVPGATRCTTCQGIFDRDNPNGR